MSVRIERPSSPTQDLRVTSLGRMECCKSALLGDVLTSLCSNAFPVSQRGQHDREIFPQSELTRRQSYRSCIAICINELLSAMGCLLT